MRIEPVFSIWNVKIGEPVKTLPDRQVSIIACGTNGGPPSLPLKSFADYAQCPPEPSGLREVYFTYDDEQDYIAKALELQYKALSGGTSVFSHPVIVSALVDKDGIVQGIRIVTDNRVDLRSRRTAVTLATNLEGRYSGWNLDCKDIPRQDGEQPVGTQFEHKICTGTNADKSQSLRIEARYLRKKGQMAINTDTQKVNASYFDSSTRFELVAAPYTPSVGEGG